MPHFTRWAAAVQPYSAMSVSASGRWLSCARSLKRVNWPSNCSSTVPVGPWRCLPMMTSALPWHHPSRSATCRVPSVPGRGSLLCEVIFLAVDEHHDVGVLLDRAGFAQVGELRALVVAAFDLTRELRQRDDRNVQFLGQRLQAGGDLGHLLHAVVWPFLPEPEQQLEIVDDEQVEALLALQPAGAGGELRDRDAAGLVDIERQRSAISIGDVAELVEIALGDPAAPDLARRRCRSARRGYGWRAVRPTFRARRSRRCRHRRFRSCRRPGTSPRHGLGDVVGDVGGERGLAHAGTAGEDDQVGALQAAHLAVEIAQARSRCPTGRRRADRRWPPCRRRCVSACAKRWKPPS